MVLSTEWSQVEVIDLINDGSGLGFGIVGGRSTGVVIKSILPGGIADRDNRLQSGDHIIQIGDVNLRGLGSEQVATVLRQAGSQVRIVVARPVETTTDYTNCTIPVVPTKILTDPEELDRQLFQNGFAQVCRIETPSPDFDKEESDESDEVNSIDVVQTTNLLNCLESNNSNADNTNSISPISPTQLIFTPAEVDIELPETERFTVKLTKNECGLGITIAGYVCEREDLSGIFVKSISEGSEAFKCGRIELNDRIIEVDGFTLQNLTNYQAVEKLKQSDVSVVLTFERYLRGPKYEHLQEAIASQETKDLSPPSPSVTTLSWIPIDAEIPIEPEGESVISVNSEIYDNNPETKEIFVEEDFESEPQPDCETVTKKKWEQIFGPDREIVIAHLTKLKGLGISLEGTVDVERGVELRPHHYIRSILPEGPVGVNGNLISGDELLEVNGQKLLGIKHVEVVKILKELPSTVRLVCARDTEKNRVINTSQDREGFEARNILGGSLRNLLPQPEQRLLKALSDTSLNTTSTATITDETNLEKSKSRSLEANNLAMWSDEIEIIELRKGDRGLGFSILDYQDPINLSSTVIVIRSLVPNGPAEQDGRLKPGDRLISVNGVVIKSATLDEAVQALKGTLPGLVKIGVSKPLSTGKSYERTA